MPEPDPQTTPEEILQLRPDSSFRGLTFEDIEIHSRIRRYGDFILTEAVSPSYDIRIRPEQGYRQDNFVDPDSGQIVSLTIAAVSAPRLMGMLQGILQKISELGCETVKVVLISSRPGGDDSEQIRTRDEIDIPVLASTLEEYENLILHDGFTGVAICSESLDFEVLFNEHKIFEFYGDLSLAEEILREHGITHKPEMQFLSEAEHIHNSRFEFCEQFDRLGQIIAG